MAFFNTKHKKKSFILTTLLVSALLLLLFYISLTYKASPTEKNITINLSTTDFSNGNSSPKATILSPHTPIAVSQKEKAQTTPTENVLTRETEEAVKIPPTRKAAQNTQENQEQEADKKRIDALISRIKTPSNAATSSENTTDKTRDHSAPQSNPYASTYYNSPGSAAEAYSLSGRTLVRKGKVQHKCNKAGKVVVQIVVNRNGQVTKAIPGVKGTTNNDPCLLEPAKQTARLHQWNLDNNAPLQQTGFIVVNFKLGP